MLVSWFMQNMCLVIIILLSKPSFQIGFTHTNRERKTFFDLNHRFHAGNGTIWRMLTTRFWPSLVTVADPSKRLVPSFKATHCLSRLQYFTWLQQKNSNPLNPSAFTGGVRRLDPRPQPRRTWDLQRMMYLTTMTIVHARICPSARTKGDLQFAECSTAVRINGPQLIKLSRRENSKCKWPTV